MNSKIDLHIHTAFSDGTDYPQQLLDTLRYNGITTFAVCDHDTIEGCRAVFPYAKDNIHMINGIEFSCKTEFKRCHILGLGIDIDNPKIKDAISSATVLREEKLQKRLKHLEDAHKIIFSQTDIDNLKKLTSVGKPHLASLLVRDGYASAIDEAIKTFLTFKGNNDRIDASLAVNAIISAGGIPVWAHPLGGEGEKRLKEDEFLKQLEILLSIGIQGLECYYSRYTHEEANFLCTQAEKYDLLISGGSDYHGKNKNILPGQLSADGSEICASLPTVLNKL